MVPCSRSSSVTLPQFPQDQANGPQGDQIPAAFEKAGFVGLAPLWESGARSIYLKKEVRSLADVKGMKIRVLAVRSLGRIIQAIGANPTPIPMAVVWHRAEDRSGWTQLKTTIRRTKRHLAALYSEMQ